MSVTWKVPFLVLLLVFEAHCGLLTTIERGITSLSSSLFESQCGEINAPTNEAKPLRWAPWLVLLTTLSEKGEDVQLNCVATLVGNRVALTSHECLRYESLASLSIIAGAPNLQDLSQGVRRTVKNVNVLLSEKRIAVLNFKTILYSRSIRPICLERADLGGIYATLGWEKNEDDYRMLSQVGESSIKVGFLKMRQICRIDGYCADVLPPGDYWEMDSTEVQEGAPFMVQHRDNYWYIKGLMLSEHVGEVRYITMNGRNITHQPLFFVKITSESVDEILDLL